MSATTWRWPRPTAPATSARPIRSRAAPRRCSPPSSPGLCSARCSAGYAWAGVILLAAGILLLALRGGRAAQRFDTRAVGFALLTALTITAYTLVDGVGARIAGSAAAYTAWLFLLSGATMAVYGFWRVGPGLVGHFKAHWVLALAGAALSTAAYAIAIWAMTVAPIALVAALRETSVLFGALFASLFLREPWIAARVAATGLVLAGALLLRMR